MGGKSESDGVATLPGDGAATAVSPAGPPIASWDRYEVFEELGRGGMSVVYRARDRRLDRLVAIKFLQSADPGQALRLLQEAQAQAQIEHPHVCRVHEVGEVGGRPYIALELIAGAPLHAAAREMMLDERIAVLRDVALAIQEAHKLGIIHRDIKPGNVLVARNGDGGRRPVVMDFGLARAATVDLRLTRSGTPIGTAAYMSPEQARGDLRAIDRRSDVYSLGATLYQLLTGHPPFGASSEAELLARVIHDEPAPPRSVAPSVPIDLETVALKCLAKDPAQRYASARALADDLGRYLAGEPIEGRRPSLWQRLRRRAHRHRAVVAVAAVSLAALAVVGGLGVRAWLASRAERTRAAELAQRLGHDAENIDHNLRIVYVLPLHDTRPARETMRARMRAIAATRHDLGALGDAMIHDALGRGHLALHEWSAASEELTLAAARLATPDLHAARGRALGEQYRAALQAARRSGDRGWLAGRQAELARQYLAPAIAELAASHGGGSTHVLAALLALARGEFAAAEHAAQDAAADEQWQVEASKLAADAAYGAAMAEFDRGAYDAARPGLDRAETLYAGAADIASSDASTHAAAAQAALSRAELAVRRGESPREPLERAQTAIDRALIADPDDAAAYTTRAYVLLRLYRTPELRGTGDQRPLLDRIAQAAARAVDRDPGDAGAWDALGNAHVYRGSYEAYHGGQGAAWWNLAVGEFGRALAIRPGDPWAHNDLGVAHSWLGRELHERGGDPMPEYRAALASYVHATKIDPGYVFAWFNQADAHALSAEYDVSRGIDPAPAAESARIAGQSGLNVDPSFDMLLDKIAEAQLSVADYRVDHGGDPSEPLRIACGYLDRAIARNPNGFISRYHRVVADRVEAQQRLRDGGDPGDAIAAGRTALREALRLLASSADPHVEAARIGLVEAAAAARAGRDPLPVLDQARRDAERAVELNDQFASAKLVAAEVYLEIAKRRAARATIERGRDLAAAALAINPQLPRAIAVRDALAQLSRR